MFHYGVGFSILIDSILHGEGGPSSLGFESKLYDIANKR